MSKTVYIWLFVCKKKYENQGYTIDLEMEDFLKPKRVLG